MAGLTLGFVCVAAAGQLVIVQWEPWVREDQRLTEGLIKSIISTKLVRVLVLASVMFLSAASLMFSLAVDPGGIMWGRGGKVGTGLGCPGLMAIKHCLFLLKRDQTLSHIYSRKYSMKTYHNFLYCIFRILDVYDVTPAVNANGCIDA